MTVDENDLRLLLMASFRYALGRKTYVVSFIAESIKKHVSVLSNQDINQILRDIGETEDKGMAVDVTTWEGLGTWLRRERDSRTD